MHEHLTILGISLIVLIYGFFSALLYRKNISQAMVFTTVGVILSPLVLGEEFISINAQSIQIMAEITLVIVLFSDASTLNLSQLKDNWIFPTRLLFVALPISIVFATIIGTLFFPNESIYYIILLALILAPTDAALGKIVVSDSRIPSVVRDTINVESGLNDGIVFPILLALLTLITSDTQHTQNSWMIYILKQISIGAIAGSLVGWLGAILMQNSIQKQWMQHQYTNLAPIALAFFSYYFAEHFSGNGYIAAFFSGLLLGNTSSQLKQHVEEFAESEGEFFVMISFLIFGLVFIPITIEYWDFKILLYALLSLTLFRMLPIIIGFGKMDVDIQTRLFYGWFGPRGLASILYILVSIHQIGDSITQHLEILATASLTILLSIILHGLSAQPLAIMYSRYIKKLNSL